MSAKIINAGRSVLSSLCAFQKPVVYNAKVAGELVKQVYVKEGMAFPTGAQFAEAQQSAKKWIQPSVVKSLTVRDAAKGAVVVAEIYTFFLIGEIVGRRNLIGYRA